MQNYHILTSQQYSEIGEKFDDIRAEILQDRGEKDAVYIQNLVKKQRRLEVISRIGMMIPFTWPLAVIGLGFSKILDNMEIGHNVMHGQYDFMNDPQLHSKKFEWDNSNTSKIWKETHNVEHHTYTNILNKDHDIGYGLLRMSDQQVWEVRFLLNVPFTIILHLFFQHFVAVQSLKLEDYLYYKTKNTAELKAQWQPIWAKMRKQLAKDYIWYPLLALPFAPLVFVGNMLANIMRNVWSCSVIFNGHFPQTVSQFSESILENETRGHWYVRQLFGSANFSGGKLLHIMSGNLSFQIEHHLFPDLPAHRYQEISPRVQAICAEYHLPYHTGSFLKQTLSTWARIVKLSVPSRLKPAFSAPAGVPQ